MFSPSGNISVNETVCSASFFEEFRIRYRMVTSCPAAEGFGLTCSFAIGRAARRSPSSTGLKLIQKFAKSGSNTMLRTIKKVGKSII